jgi:superfamily II DNA or RNA helicase
MDVNDADQQAAEYANIEEGKQRLIEWLDEDQMKMIIQNNIFKGNVDKGGLSPWINADPAAFLLSYYAYDILAEREIRENLVSSLIHKNGNAGLFRLLIKLYNQDAPEDQEKEDLAAIRRWEKGGPMANAFAAFFEFPKEFAGSRDGHYELIAKEAIQARESLPSLHDYQSMLIDRMTAWLNDIDMEDGSGILVLPTGTGKTRVAGELLIDFLAERCNNRSGQVRDVILWLAHTMELCEQAHETLGKIWTCKGPEGKFLNLYRFWGNIDVGELQGASGCVIAGVQKMYDTIRDESKATILNNYLTRRLRLIVIDEAHLADNPSYKKILNFFSQNPSYNNGRSWKLLGLSATPFKSEEGRNRDLQRMFRRRFSVDRSMTELGGPEGLNVFKWMQEKRYLSHNISYKPLSMPATNRFKLRPTEVDYMRSYQDLNETALARLSLDEYRNDMIVDTISKAISDGSMKILLFACSVPHCYILRAALAEKGVRAFFVTGSMSKQERSRVISLFKAEKRRPIVLINFAILTTGFDDPKIDTVFITRPTWSRVLYHQMIGRGLRGEKNGGNPGGRCLILDVRDNFEEFEGLRGVVDYKKERDLWDTEAP